MPGMTDALARSNPLLGGVDPDGLAAEVKAGDDNGAGSFDGKGVRDAVSTHRDQVVGLQNRMTELDARSDALRPPEMVQAPKPPEVHDTPPGERWGSVAMMLAGFGGLLTRQPLTASLNAMAQVNHAYNEGDAEKAKTAFDTWKTENDNAMKMNAFQAKAYDSAIKKIATDRTGAIGEIRALAASFKDDVVINLMDAGQTDKALAVLGARSTGGQLLQERTEKLIDQHAAMDYWDQSNPEANPQQRGLAHAAIRAGKDPAGNPTATQGAENDAVTLATADFKRLHNRDPEKGSAEDDEEMARLRQVNRGEGKAAGKPVTGAAADSARIEREAAADFKQQKNRDADPANPDDRNALDRLIDQHKATNKLAGSPYMQGLNAQEGQAVQRAVQADPSVLDDPDRMGALVHRVAGRGVMTPGQIESVQDHARSISHAMDAIERIKAAMEKATGVAGGLGRPLRATETIGNILGYLPETDRADFRAALSYLQYEAPDLLKRRASATQGARLSPQLEDIISNQKWGDTYENVTSRMNELQGVLLTDYRALNEQVTGSGSEPLPGFHKSGGAATPRTAAGGGGGVPTVTEEQYNALPKGAHYRMPDAPDTIRTKQ